MSRVSWGLVLLVTGIAMLGAGMWARWGWSLAAVVIGALLVAVDLIALVQGDGR